MSRTPLSPRSPRQASWADSPRSWKARAARKEDMNSLISNFHQRQMEKVKADENMNVASVETEEVPLSRKRKYTALEILSTEQTYVDQLGVLIKSFKVPLTYVIMDPAMIKKFPDENELRLLFSNIDVIYSLNSKLLQQLSKCIGDYDEDDVETQMVSQPFIDLAPFMSLYGGFCSNYVDAIRTLSTLKKEKPEFAEWIRDRVSRCGHELTDLLILPVQRIPRYRMLLESLLKVTGGMHPDFSGLSDALIKIEETADRLNDTLLRVENQRKFVSFEQRLLNPVKIEGEEGGLLKAHRRYIADFQFTLLERDSAVELHPIPEDSEAVAPGATPSSVPYTEKKVACVLLNDMLVVTAPVTKKEGEEMLDVIDCVTVHDSFIKKMLETNAPINSFQYVNPKRTFVFRAPTTEEKNRFKDSIQAAVKQRILENPSLLEKRNWVKLNQNSHSNLWEAIASAPAFGARVTAQELEAETAAETKKALEALLADNKEYFDSQPLCSASKKDVFGGIRGLLSTLSPQKKKRSAKASEKDEEAESAPTKMLTQEIQKWNTKLEKAKKDDMSKQRAQSSPAMKSPKVVRKSKSKEEKKKKEKKAEEAASPRGTKRRLEEVPEDKDASPPKKLRLEEPSKAPMSPKTSISPQAAKSPEAKHTASPDPMVVVQLKSPRDLKNDLSFRNDPRAARPRSGIVSPSKPLKAASSPKPVAFTQAKENVVNESPSKLSSKKSFQSPAKMHYKSSSMPVEMESRSPRSPLCKVRSPSKTASPVPRLALGATGGSITTSATS